MARLFYLNRRGHTEVQWNPIEVAQGETEAAQAVAEAERLLAQALQSGHAAFIIADGVATRRVTAIDRAADDDIVLIPPVAGG